MLEMLSSSNVILVLRVSLLYLHIPLLAFGWLTA